jgi:hypothetical protein
MLKTLVACVVLLGAIPTTAAAEWHFTPLIGLTFKGATNIPDIELAAGENHKNFGGAVSLLGGGIIGVEAVVLWTPGMFENDDVAFDSGVPGGERPVDKSRAISFMGNIVLTTPRQLTEYSLRPYFSGGVGLMHATVIQNPAVALIDDVHHDAVGFNLGGGAIGFFSERTGVRFDFRYHSTFRRSADLVAPNADSRYIRYMTVSVGVVFRRR